MRKWVKLAERCEKAKGPDREIDFKIGFATGWRRYIHDGNDMIIDWEGNMFPDYYGSMLPSVTESLDAITALIERELPGNMRSIRKYPDGEAVAQVWNSQVGETPRQRCCASEALALCAAFCRAMNEKEANA